MAVTASNATFTNAEFRTGKKASWISNSTGFLTKGATAATDHYLRTPLNSLTMIHPQPTSVYTSFTSVWSKWTPDAPYYAYPSAYGGCFPYKWTLSGAPTGMTIQEDFDFTSYTTRAAHGRIYWASPTAGTHTFIVRCTDQEGTTVSQTVSLNVATSNAIFVSPSGTDSTDTTTYGTKASPIQKIDNWYAAVGGSLDPADTRNANKIIIYRAGTYTVPEDTGLGNLNMGANKPCTHVAYYGETVEFDCSNSAFRWAASNGAGTLDRAELIGLTFSGEDEVEMAQCYQIFLSNGYVIICDHTVKDWKNGGSTPANNPSSIANSDRGSNTWWDYCQFRNIQFTGLGGGTNLTQVTCSGLEQFTIRHFEFNNIKLVSQSGSVGNFLKLKHYSQKGVVRLVEAVSFTTSFTGMQFFDDTGNPPGADKLEVEYCCVGATGGNAINFASLAVTPGDYGTTAIRRNTFLTRPAALAERTTGEMIRGSNVLVNSAAGWTDNSTWTGHITVETTDLAATSGLVDANGRLTGTDRTNYLGIKGWEIA